MVPVWFLSCVCVWGEPFCPAVWSSGAHMVPLSRPQTYISILANRCGHVLSLCVWMCAYCSTYVEVRGRLKEVGSSLPPGGPGNWTLIVRLSGKCLYSLRHLASLALLIFQFWGSVSLIGPGWLLIHTAVILLAHPQSIWDYTYEQPGLALFIF